MSQSLKDIVRERILSLIQKGEWKVGMHIPSERVLAEEFGVSRVTVREALQHLGVEGVIQRTPGRGTRVVAPLRRDRANGPLVLVLPNLHSDYFGAIAEAMLDRLAGNGHELVIRLHHDDPDRFESILRECISGGVAGVAIVISRRCPDSCIELLEQIDFPVVLLGRSIGHLAVHQVVVDNEHIGRLATEHLLTLGHRRIACLAVLDYPVGRERFLGYCRALEAHGLEFESDLIADLSQLGVMSESGGKAIDDLHARGVEFTAIVAFNHRQALLAMESLQEHRLRIPQDVAVMGIDDNLSVPVPSLSTVHIDWRQIGHEGAECLLTQINQGMTRPEISFCKATVVPRRTCGYLLTRKEP